MFEEADLIYRYTRAQSIEDGVLIDVSAVAREAGITYPVALTRAAWERCVTVPPGAECQDEAGRLCGFGTACATAALRLGHIPAAGELGRTGRRNGSHGR